MKLFLAFVFSLCAFGLNAQNNQYPQQVLYFTQATGIGVKIAPATMYATVVTKSSSNNAEEFILTAFDQNGDVIWQTQMSTTNLTLDLSGHLLTVETTNGKTLYLWGQPKSNLAGK